MARTHKLKAKPCPENPERARMRPTYVDKGGRVVEVPGKPVRSLLASLLARSDQPPKVAGVPIPAEVVQAMQTVEAFVATLDGEKSEAL